MPVSPQLTVANAAYVMSAVLVSRMDHDPVKRYLNSSGPILIDPANVYEAPTM